MQDKNSNPDTLLVRMEVLKRFIDRGLVPVFLSPNNMADKEEFGYWLKENIKRHGHKGNTTWKAICDCPNCEKEGIAKKERSLDCDFVCYGCKSNIRPNLFGLILFKKK